MDDNHPRLLPMGIFSLVPHSGQACRDYGNSQGSKAQKRTGLPGGSREKLSCIFSFRLGNPQPGKSLPISRPHKWDEKGKLGPSPAGLKGQW